MWALFVIFCAIVGCLIMAYQDSQPRVGPNKDSRWSDDND